MNRILVVGIVLLVCAAIQAQDRKDAAGGRRPNVVMFLVDDMGWMDCGVYGSKYYETPNMDRFAAKAMRFTDAYAQPLCSPTRASLMTGKYSARHGITSASGHQPPESPPRFLAPRAVGRMALARRIRSRHRNEILADDFLAVVIDPGKHYGTGFLRAEPELNVRVGRDRRFEVSGKHLLAVHGANELVQDLARDRVSAGVLALTGLHDMRYQGLDLDEVIFFRFKYLIGYG